jgi:hypothetical protein
MQIPEGEICWQETMSMCCASQTMWSLTESQELLELYGTKLVTVDLGGKEVKAAGSTIDRIL